MSLFQKIKDGLKKTATSLSRGFSGIFAGTKTWDDATYAQLERTLLEADFGPEASRKIVEELRKLYELGKIATEADARFAAADVLANMLQPAVRSLKKVENGPTVILFTGVNGSGKTTSIGKLAHHLVGQGFKVMLGACDTFRAAAAEQLQLWGERTGSAVVAGRQGSDPAAVAFDAVKSAAAKGVDYLLIDTAGRQQNRKGLMDELVKIRRVIGKVIPDAPHETILTLDASQGMNALSQAREFAAQAGADALILTKLDGTGKGGAACAVHQEFHLPILFTGLGEQPDDLQIFDPQSYSRAVFSCEDGE